MSGSFGILKPELYNISREQWSKNQSKSSQRSKAIYKDLKNKSQHMDKPETPFYKGNQSGIYYYRYKNNNWQDIYNRRALSPTEQIKLITGGKIKIRLINYHGSIECDILPKTFTPSNDVIIVHDTAAGEGSFGLLYNQDKLKGFTEVLKQLKHETKDLSSRERTKEQQKEIINRFRKLFMDIVPKYYPIEEINNERISRLLFPPEYDIFSIPRRYDELYKKYKEQWNRALTTDQSLDLHLNTDDDFLVGKTKKWETFLDMPCDDKPMCNDRKNYRKKGSSNFSYNRPVCCPSETDWAVSKSVCRKSKDPNSVVGEKRCYWDYKSKNLPYMDKFKKSLDEQLHEVKLKYGVHNPDKPVALQVFDINPDNDTSQSPTIKKGLTDQNGNKIIGGVYVLNDNFKLINLPLFTFNPQIFGNTIDLQTIIQLDKEAHKTNEDDIFIYIIESCRDMVFPTYLKKDFTDRVRQIVDDLSDDEGGDGEKYALSHYLKKPPPEAGKSMKSTGGKRRKTRRKKRRKKRTKKKARKRKKTRRKRK